MSRSFKKNPIIKIAPKRGKIGKKFANRKIRRSKKEICNGKHYCKFYEQYDIHDYIWRKTYSDYKKDYESSMKRYVNGTIHFNPDEYEHTYNDWFKDFKRK